MRRLLPILIIGVIAFLAGAFFLHQWTNNERTERVVEATVMLEKVRQVCKLVTLEGQFSELYNEDNYREVTLYLPIPTKWRFNKSAIIQVEGTVLVGYDLKKVSITVDSLERTVTLNNLPQPEILAVDHNLTYRNLEESFFNSFSPEDYTQLNRNAKEVLSKQANESGLLEDAKVQGLQLLEGLGYLVEGAGYQLIIREQQAPLPAG